MDAQTYSAMQTGTPHKSYIKTILGRVRIFLLNPFSKNPEELLLFGNPRQQPDSAIIDMWSPEEDLFFRKKNKIQFEKGNLIEFIRPETTEISEEEKYNTLTNEELTVILKAPFFNLQRAMEKMTAVAPVFRLLSLAEDMGKSEKYMNHIRARISELQEINPKQK